MRKTLIFVFIVIMFLLFIYRIKINYEQKNFLRELSSVNIHSHYDKKLFVGTWYSSQAKREIIIKQDSTWVMRGSSGYWGIQNGNFVWVYDRASDNFFGGLDKNKILSVEPNRFILKEVFGSETLFTRLN